MKIIVKDNKVDSALLAAQNGADMIRAALAARGEANIIVATGASQFEMLDALTKQPDIRWDKITGFHLDEYVGLPITHPASFRGYLWKRFVSQLPLPLKAFNYVNAESDPQAECDRLGKIIGSHPIDVAFIGIGENAHIAFNDPPADFETETPYLVVQLDEACRKQQLGEGWFPTFDDVPSRAISMSVRHILKSSAIVCTVPDERKSVAVRDSVEGPITPFVPGSILQKHNQCTLYLDVAAASKLKK